MADLNLYDKSGTKSGTAKLADLFRVYEPNNHLIYLASVLQDANARAGSAHTKTRCEVRGGGAKPWRQKGTGRARAGSSRSPLWRGGGVTHGPRNNVNWTKGMNKKEKLRSLLSAFVQSIKLDKVSVVKDFSVKDGKTKELVSQLESMSFYGKKLLLIADASNSDFILLKRASSNIRDLKLISSESLNVNDMLIASKILVSESAMKQIEERFSGIQIKPREEQKV
jgi:large subunit ribosomal protein L4